MRTAGALALLQAALPANLALTSLALLVGRSPARERAAEPLTVMISGGKMTKALTLARAFHAAGHRVVLVEQEKYRLTGHRFSRAVDAFHAVPRPQDPGYADALLDVVRRERVDVYVPVCSPVASHFDALAEAVLAPYCQVVHASPAQIDLLDDKAAFAALAASMGLGVPETHRVTSAEQVAAIDLDPGKRYVLKSIAYDPVHRLDLTPLPLATPEQTRAFAAAKPMSEANPWILQELVVGREYCTHGTVRDGELTVWCCCESSPFQVNYEHVDKPDIEAWVGRFVKELGLTGQASFDFIETSDGRALAIECNPRTHSAITMFHDRLPALARAYFDPAGTALTPSAAGRPTYWIYHELWRLLAEPGRAERLRTIARGTDAIFAWDDPLPFLVEHHVQIPWLLLRSLVAGKDWIRIDFNIGKLVEPAGD